MQTNQEIPDEKGLFTFYKQQQHFHSQHPVHQNYQNNPIPPNFSNKKKAKKKIKHHTEPVEKSSHQNQANLEFEPIKEETRKKPKLHKKKSKLNSKKTPQQPLANNSTLPQNNSQSPDKKQQFLSITNSYNSSKKPIEGKQIPNSVAVIVKFQEKAKVTPLNRSESPTLKKTIISEANMTIKPFQKQSTYDEDDYLVNGFGSAFNLHKKNPQSKVETSQNNEAQSNQKIQSSLQNEQNANIKERFLAKVIRKNLVYNPSSEPQSPKRVNFQRARCVTELAQKKESLAALFQNKQITESFAEEQKSETSAAKSMFKNPMKEQTTQDQLKIDKYLRFESKTQELRRMQKGQLRRFSKVTSVHLPQQKEENFRCEINSSSFMPAHRSSLAIQQVLRENSEIFESYDVYKNYRRLKTKSKKLLRFSMIKSQTTKGIEKDKAFEEISIHSKKVEPKSIQTFKLPAITNGHKKIDQSKPRVLSSELKSQKNDNKAEETKQSQAQIKSENFEKQKHSAKTTQMKQRLRCYTQEHQCQKPQIDEPVSKIFSIIGAQKRDSNRSRLRKQPEEESHNKKFIQKSISTKIIQNFQEKHYKKAEEQKDGSKLATFDMSQNFMLNWKESLDWQSKKKLIVKKLGIKI